MRSIIPKEKFSDGMSTIPRIVIMPVQFYIVQDFRNIQFVFRIMNILKQYFNTQLKPGVTLIWAKQVKATANKKLVSKIFFIIQV